MSLWWSSVLSSHIAGCRCPGGREAHLRRCAGSSELFSAGLSGWERCSSRTRRWCSQLGCSPQCNCWTVWGFLNSRFLRPNLSSDRGAAVAWWIERWTFNPRLWVRISALAEIVHGWGETLEQGTEPPTAPQALPTAPGVCVCVCVCVSTAPGVCVFTWMG